MKILTEVITIRTCEDFHISETQIACLIEQKGWNRRLPSAVKLSELPEIPIIEFQIDHRGSSVNSSIKRMADRLDRLAAEVSLVPLISQFDSSNWNLKSRRYQIDNVDFELKDVIELLARRRDRLFNRRDNDSIAMERRLILSPSGCQKRNSFKHCKHNCLNSEMNAQI
jgi:hypothetical protein